MRVSRVGGLSALSDLCSLSNEDHPPILTELVLKHNHPLGWLSKFLGSKEPKDDPEGPVKRSQPEGGL